jgi:hypothetical protein
MARPGGDVEAAVAALAAWRDGNAELTPSERAWCSEPTLRRYCIARNASAEAALKMLQDTLAWRKSALEPPLCCPRCDLDTTAHCFIPLGIDGTNVFVYGSPPRASQTNVEDTVRHVVQSLEHCFDAHGCEQWTWLVDFKDFGLTHAMQARLGITFASVFAAHFPERLRSIVLINSPTVFSMLLAALRPFADPRTLAKVVTVTGEPAVAAAALEAHGVPPRIRAWMRAALAAPSGPGRLPPLPAGAGALVSGRGTRPVVAPVGRGEPEALHVLLSPSPLFSCPQMPRGSSSAKRLPEEEGTAGSAADEGQQQETPGAAAAAEGAASGSTQAHTGSHRKHHGGEATSHHHSHHSHK